ncbi:CEL4b mannanase [Pholiota conissans]|uniref:mannan endo-1,4-beta-mannosidase n=1 Tax=Pholiota conissans TaxID=109636 RepID=A0A9P5Z880_9AGAR|nr:CEL4b mannanase [Pholiota conissans]
MLKLSPGLIALALYLPSTFATAIYGQCGGIGFTGDTTCASGTTCQVENPYYSQCLPGTATATTTTTKPTTTTTTTMKPTTTTTTTTGPTTTAAPPSPTGFVKASGTAFSLNGSKFTVVGENSYWVGLMGYSTTDMNKAFADIASAGSTVVRTWGFNEVTSPNGIYYQSWSGSTPTVNTGASGLANFDNVIAAAKANGIRLIVALQVLTNNWSDYGGMDVYVKQILNSPNHDLFYTDATVKAAFKNYIRAFVGRYLNEPTIMAWELANEPRCKGSTGTSTGTCTTTTVTAWIKEISAYIKSIDTNHLVAVGDEGFYNQPSAPTYPYQGSEGVDFDANLAISAIDFGTFHSYPTSWGQSGNESAWGTQWIADHATSQKKANKPVIIEEFGVTSNQATIYTTWLNQVVSSGLTGELIWQAGSHLTNGDTPNDGYAVYVDGPVFPVIKAAAAQLKARA